jgi:alcohol dehydrogenase (cytochrome c)
MGRNLFSSVSRLSICAGYLVALVVSASYSHAQQVDAPTRAPGAPPPPTSFQMAPITEDVTNSDSNRINVNVDDWRLHGRTYDNQRFSPLTQINARNLHLLRPSALIQTGVADAMEATPIVVNGIMYIETAGNTVQAYDAATGEEKWTYVPHLEYSDLCCGPQARGVAVADGKVFVAQVDGNVVALDARTGNVIWKADKAELIPKPQHWYSFTGAPQVYDGLVMVGNGGAEWPTRGFYAALDENTGKLVWRFWDTAGPDDPNFEGAWEGDSWKVGGGSIWDAAAIDPKNDLAFFAIGNPNPDMYGGFRGGNNLYTDSIVAVHAKTGKLAWYYQQVPHDVWDYDSAAPVMLFNVPDELGKMVPAAAEANKNGFLYIVNRLTGKLIRRSDAFVRQSPTFGIVPDSTPRVYYPGNHGGAMWQPPAYSPLTHYYYTMAINQPSTYKAQPSEQWKPGDSEIAQHFGNARATAEEVKELDLDKQRFRPYGNITAIDVNTGKIAWQHDTQNMMLGGVLATASNLIFTGEWNGNFEAFDARTGKNLWQYHLGIGVCTPPITYRVKGIQYIAVGANGCHQSENTMAAAGRPIFGDTIAIFSLPDKRVSPHTK